MNKQSNKKAAGSKKTKSVDVTKMTCVEFVDYVNELVEQRKNAQLSPDDSGECMLRTYIFKDDDIEGGGFRQMDKPKVALVLLDELSRYMQESQNPFADLFGK